ncbi:hypothetical protein I8748_20605 [Nostoc sp. CENA67]|uniref:Uncharacterized protein n=1 Tax=Amazonocrinis nigriterrae CENA67 TaxID=2794033 RepID=A0A8J7HUP9_9NOST|nr:hypothetical protein [Amazonocrinis nigriterrae]MBH8564555.1 hypothetical protein [Amazonocrinis nigriterrae CENA67]
MLLTNLKSLVTSDSSDFVKEKLLLRESQNRTLKADVEKILSYQAWIKAKTQDTFDSTRILGIVAAGKGAENYLPYTIPKIIKQISETGMLGDIIIGLNNGFECPTVIDRFTALSNVEVIHLYTENKSANNVPAQIFDNFLCENQPYCLSNMGYSHKQHRIFIVHQKKGAYAAGKIRVLGDIYGSLLLSSINNGWIPPEIMFTFDAESQFLVERNYPFVEPDSNGLKLIINELDKNSKIDILSTRNRFAVYQKALVDGIEALLPNFSQEIPPIQLFIDLCHGRYSGYQWMQGGGTFGKTDALVSLLVVISQTYPGSKIEDTQLSILAKYAGFVCEVFLDVVSTNRTPDMMDITMDEQPKKGWIEQMARWIAGVYALELCYGKHNIQTMVSRKIPLSIWIKPIKFLQMLKGKDEIRLDTVLQKVKILAIAFVVFQNLKKRSIDQPDILQGNEAKAHW